MPTFQVLYHQINWHQPWYATLTIPKNAYLKPDSVCEWLNIQLINTPIVSHRGSIITFVPQSALPESMAYESFIGDTGNICTRDNLHDLLNGIVWLNYPKTKALLNHLHTLDIADHGITSHRSPLRNALTLFDENGGIVVSSHLEVLHQLQNFEWEKALFDNRQTWLTPNQQVQFFPFGHALLEKLIIPRNNITSHVLLLKVSAEFFELSIIEQRQNLDTLLTEHFLAEYEHILISKHFQPLPLMGIPSFCADNNAREFYQDKNVFRQARERKARIFDL